MNDFPPVLRGLRVSS